MLKSLVKLLPANTIASLIADYVTLALSKIDDKDKAEKISVAVSECGNAVKVSGDAVKDCKITEDEVNIISSSVKDAVLAIIEAAK